jgi:hypothetical protein
LHENLSNPVREARAATDRYNLDRDGFAGVIRDVAEIAAGYVGWVCANATIAACRDGQRASPNRSGRYAAVTSGSRMQLGASIPAAVPVAV